MVQAAEQGFEALVRRAVERFVQSAVVVDDRAVMGVSAEPIKLVTPALEAEALAVVEGLERAEETPDDTEARDPADTGLDAKGIVDAFAARGVVCAVLRPSPGEVDELKRVAPNAIRRTDLLILDWHLQGDDGEAAVGLLKQVVEEAGAAMRLVAIYTGEPKLDAVVRRLADELGADQIDPVSVQVGALRIVVLGKAVEDDGPPGSISERDLPDKLMEHFADLADGLVRAAALSALGALRGATYRLLAGLDRAIDLGYVGQRALIFPSSEAESDLLGMLVSELRAIIEDDADTRACADAEAVAFWLQREAAASRGGAFPPEVLAAFAETYLFDGDSLGALKKKHPELRGLKKPRQDEGLTNFFTTDPAVAKTADERFAMRMTLKQVYDRPERVLSLGTIVKGGGDDYLLCIQPVCDSLRIDGEQRYPFVPLSVVDERFHYVIQDEGKTLYLRLSRSPSEIQHWTFGADSLARAALAIDSPLCFVDTSDTRFRWVAQLNDAHAQRAAHEIGAAQSRVGLAESDWLRRMSK